MIPVLTQHFVDFCRFSFGLSRKTRPFFVSCEVTFRCNLRCEFCNIPDFNPIPEEAATQVMEKRLEESYRLGCRVISFTGGEPLMRSDIGLLATRCCELGYFTGLVTNGLLLGKQVNSEWLHKIDAPAVSFLADEESYNRTRRIPNAYALVSRNIRDAVDAGLSPILFSTLTKETFQHAEKTAAFAHNLGINVYFSLVQRSPREEFDTINYESLKVSNAHSAIEQLRTLRREYGCVRFDPDFERMQAAGGFNDFIHCRAAQTVVSIKPDGSVSLPCPPKTLLSIKTDMPLEEHWNGKKARQIRSVRGTMPFCKDCQVNCMYLPSLVGHPVLLANWIRNNGR
ncbi:radical SAM protein [Methanoregula sp.]|uniref:radical SAM protein n=1 Tax=Methanoregula sp. TaxID=2052170 RepID=UPI00356592CD